MAAQKRTIKVFGMGMGEQSGSMSRSDLAPADLTRILAEANGFDLSYLAENARGELAQGQGRLLVRHLIGPLVIIFVSLGFMFYQFYSQGYFKQISTGLPLEALLSDLPQGMLIFSAVLLLVGLWGIYLLAATLLDMVGGVVASLEGQGWKKMTTSRDDDGSTTTRTYYVIADQKFSVQSKGYSVLENGRSYRVYFTPRRKILVNIEALD